MTTKTTSSNTADGDYDDCDYNDDDDNNDDALTMIIIIITTTTAVTKAIATKVKELF